MSFENLELSGERPARKHCSGQVVQRTNFRVRWLSFQMDSASEPGFG